MTKKRIAVLGGGVAALTAAFYITEEADWADRYEITVYQQGWRLGGKCASGHDLRQGYGARIYEHGLHIFAGFYDQAFDALRRAYEVLDRPDHHPNQTVWGAFTPEDTITLVDQSVPGCPNLEWYLNFQPNERRPGDSLAVAPLTVMIQRMVGLLLHGSAASLQTQAPTHPPGTTIVQDAINWISNFVHKTEDELASIATNVMLHELVSMLETHMLSIRSANWDENTKILAERCLLATYLVQSVIHGVAQDNVLALGYDSLDKYEWSEWLYKNALEVAQGQSPKWGRPEDRAAQLLAWTPISSLYDYVFGFGDGGDVTKPNFAAGTALRSAMLMISYSGHFFWKMRGAMGDVVIAPLYLALLKRGVKFQFFSRITSLNIDPVTDELASIDYVRQVELKDPSKPYQPLIYVPIPGWPADLPLEGWPAEPLWDQIKDGRAIEGSRRDLEAENLELAGADDVPMTLKKGVDFDATIIGISVGGLKQVCATFPARLPKSNWGPMFGALTLTRTCAMQLWLKRDLDDLGSGNSNRTLAGSDQPYSAWSDMSHLLSREIWNGADRPRSLLYFCGQIQGPENGAPANHKAYELALQWLRASTPIFFTRATSPTSPYGLDPDLLYDPDPAAPGDVLTRQYIAANCNPSDLYVQSPKMSVFTRMDANQSGLSNLFLAGDWTHNGLNSGCAEAAARSGWRAAQAVLGKLPALAL